MWPAAFIQVIAPTAHRLLAIVTALALVTGLGAQSPTLAQQQQQTAPTFGPEQIDQLVAPIALYPDNLLGQILSASTYPLEVVMASRWSAANPNLNGQRLEDAMHQQPWDPSVKALTAVPLVLAMMNDKLDWTQQIGEAYLAQPDDIAASVQRLRARADASGNLKPSQQIRVRREPAPEPVYGMGPEYIIIEPSEPEMLYVPVYDPWDAYGPWPYPAYRPFYWYPPGYVAVGVIGFGAPIIVGAALWANYNWRSRRVSVNVNQYNKFNKTTLSNTAANQGWKHNALHRRNLPYKNQFLQTQFSKPGLVKTNLGTKKGAGIDPQFLNKAAVGNTTKKTFSNQNNNLGNSGYVNKSATTTTFSKKVDGTKTTTFTNKGVVNSNTTFSQAKGSGTPKSFQAQPQVRTKQNKEKKKN